jgi:hypothetical protein
MTQRLTISEKGFVESINALNKHLDEICGRSHVVYFNPFQFLEWHSNGYAAHGRLTYKADDEAPEEALAIARQVVEDYSHAFHVTLGTMDLGRHKYSTFQLWR